MDVTALVANELSGSNIKSGVCYLYVPHTTAGITVNEYSREVTTDITRRLEKLVPVDGSYLHGEGNSDAHIKASMMGFSGIIPVINGKLALGTWQAIYFCEFDGPRRRKLLIGISGD